MSVASTIYGQLGGNRFAVMTGAKNFVSSENALTFRIPKAKNGINAVRIILNEMDLYDIEFIRVWGTTVKPVSNVGGIYADQLRDVFTSYTGLYTSL